MKKNVKVWLGVGAFVVGVGGAASSHSMARAASADPQHPQSPVQTATSAAAIVVAQHRSHGEGGENEGGERAAKMRGSGAEGGEGGEAGATGLPPDLDFALKIALMRGHLAIGNELVGERQWNAAFPHFGHPAEELYGGIRNRLKAYGAPPFEAALRNLLNVVKSKKGGDEYSSAYRLVLDALDAAERGVASRQTDRPAFEVAAALEVLKVAADEYDAAIVKGRIAKPVEYQDARGFVFQAASMIDAVSSDLERKNSGALKGVQSAIASLKEAFPTAMPPKAPVRDYGAVLSDVSRVELAAGPLM